MTCGTGGGIRYNYVISSPIIISPDMSIHILVLYPIVSDIVSVILLEFSLGCY